jgi:hypothetical protein
LAKDKAISYLAWGAYPMALLLVLAPLAELTARIWPLRPESISWRFGALGMAFNVAVTPLLGVFLAIVTAVWFGHRRWGRFASVLSFVVGGLLLIALADFGLDYLQIRTGVIAENLDGVHAAALRAFVLGGASAIAAALVGFGGWRATSSRAVNVTLERARLAATGGKDQGRKTA